MRMQGLAAALVLMQLGGCQVGHAQTPKPELVAKQQIIDQVLDKYPVCEASGAAWIGAGDGRDVLVVDNEAKKKIFRYRQEKNGVLVPVPEPKWEMKTGEEIEDAEALATAGTRVFLVASHGRKKSCKPESKRVRVAVFQESNGELTRELVTGDEGWGDSLKQCETKLLKGVASSPLKKEICKIIEEKEAAAAAEFAAKAKDDPCANRISSFMIEGAFAATDSSGTSRLWAGLRAPTLPDGSAILLRFAPLTDGATASFDAVATIPLEGKGIRDLTLDGEWLWGIAGSALDSKDASSLFRVRAGSITDGARLTGDAVKFVNEGKLPASAEGLVVDVPAQRAVIVVDGEGGEDGATACDDPAKQIVLPLEKP